MSFHYDFLKQILDLYNIHTKHSDILYKYCLLLQAENEKYDLTAHKSFEDIVYNHVIDSLVLCKYSFFSSARIIGDIGTGAGAPGLILALNYPEKQFFLVEVSQKRLKFLEKALAELNVSNCTIVPFDFKTVIRKNMLSLETQIILSRATLPFKDLLYIFGGKSQHHNAHLIYWASKKDCEMIKQSNFPGVDINYCDYLIEKKNRFLIDAYKKR